MRDRRLGPFVLGEALGEGAHAVVFRATHAPTGRAVAVKVLRERDRSAVRALEREVQAVASLSHPGIVEVYDTGIVPPRAGPSLKEGTRWVALELAVDGSLAKAGAPKRYTTVQQVLLQVLAGLAHAHARGVVHRDLKPANVLRMGRRLKLGDFGLAWAAGLRGGPRIAGTPAYMAPEQIRGDLSLIGPATDLYALGCMAWELTTGRPPFLGNQEAMFSQHTSEPLPAFLPRIDVPDGFGEWLLTLLTKEVDERCDHAALAAAQLRDLGTDVVDGMARPLTTGEVDPRTWTESLTNLFDDEEVPAPNGAAPDGAPWILPRADWRLAQRSRAPVWLLGTSLGLYTLRAVPVVGRYPERDHAWRVLRRVAEERVATALGISGAPGMGTSSLGRWLCESVREAGVGAVVRAEAEAFATIWDEVEPLTRRGLVVVWVDDPDDASATRWVASLAVPARHALPVLVLFTREEPVDGAIDVPLHPLPDPDMVTLCHQVAGLDEGAAVEVTRRVGGVPGDALTLIRALVEEERLVHGHHGFDVPGGFAHLPPTRAQQAAADMARLVRDGGHDLRPVAVAALLGARVSHGSWRRLCEGCGIPSDPEPFAPLLASGALRWTGRWRFRTSAVADALLAQLPDDEVASLAGRLADALDEEHTLHFRHEVRAVLLLQARRYADALTVATEAPDTAITARLVWAARTALAHAQVAPGGPYEAWLALRTLVDRRGDGDAAAAHREAEERVANVPVDERGMLWPALCTLALRAGAFERGLEALDEALALARTPYLLRRRALVLEQLDRLAEAEATAREGLALARAIGDTLELPALVNDVADWERVHGRIDAAEAGFREALRLARAHQHLHVRLVARENLALVLVDRGHWSEAEEALTEVVAWSLERASGQLVRPTVLALLCVAATHTGRRQVLEDALVRLESEPAHRVGLLGVEGLMQLGQAAKRVGHPSLAGRLHDVMRRVGPRQYELALTKVEHGFFGPDGPG